MSNSELAEFIHEELVKYYYHKSGMAEWDNILIDALEGKLTDAEWNKRTTAFFATTNPGAIP